MLRIVTLPVPSEVSALGLSHGLAEEQLRATLEAELPVVLLPCQGGRVEIEVPSGQSVVDPSLGPAQTREVALDQVGVEAPARQVVLFVHGGEKVGHWSGGVMRLRAE